MKRFLVFLGAMLLAASFTTASMADGGWDKCKGCHNGTIAPTGEQLKEKYKTADEVVTAAETTTNAMMKAIRGNEEALKEAAEDLMAAPAAE